MGRRGGRVNKGTVSLGVCFTRRHSRDPVSPPGPVGSLEVVVEPAEEDLVRRETEEFFDRLPVVEEAVELRVVFDANLRQETPPNDLPDETEDEVLRTVSDVLRSDVDDRASDTLGRGDNDVVVLRDLEGVERLRLPLGDRRLVKDTLVDRVRDRVVDELAENETVYGRDSRQNPTSWKNQRARTYLGTRRTAASCSRG